MVLCEWIEMKEGLEFRRKRMREYKCEIEEKMDGMGQKVIVDFREVFKDQ